MTEIVKKCDWNIAVRPYTTAWAVSMCTD